MDPVRRRFAQFTLKELKALKGSLEIWAPIVHEEAESLWDEVLDEFGMRFNDLQTDDVGDERVVGV